MTVPRILVSVFCLILMTSGCVKMTSVRCAAGYENLMQRYNSVLVLPSIAEVSTVDAVNRKERMYDYESHLEEIIHKEIVPNIQAKGFRVKVLHKKEVRGKELGDSVIRLRQRYNHIREELYESYFWDEEKARALKKNVGAPAIALGKITHSDLLILVDYVATSKTSGARALSFAGTIAMAALTGRGEIDNSTEHAAMVIGIIDAKNGDVLWMNMHSASKDLISSSVSTLSSGDEIDSRRVNDLISGVLNGLDGKR